MVRKQKRRAEVCPEEERMARAMRMRVVERVVPGHDPAQFQKFPTQGQVAKIR